ncbi:MAG: hypothetical protein PGN11_07050 [Quadrisphaera sp.]
MVGERGDTTSEDGTSVAVRDADGAVVVVPDGLEPPGRLGGDQARRRLAEACAPSMLAAWSAVRPNPQRAR